MAWVIGRVNVDKVKDINTHIGSIALPSSKQLKKISVIKIIMKNRLRK